MEEQGIIKMTATDISKAENCALNVNQLNLVIGSTPQNAKYTRPAKGGGEWTYVTGTYVKKVLNLAFGWNWDFEIKEHKYDIGIGQIFVLGKLTCRSGGVTIVKEQFGRQDIKFKSEKVFNEDGTPKMFKNKWGKEVQETRPSTIPLDLGNDLKGAATDALKKCASEIGIASDVYAPEEFKSLKLYDEEESTESKEDFINSWLIEFSDGLKPEDLAYIQDALDNGKTALYNKIINNLKKIVK